MVQVLKSKQQKSKDALLTFYFSQLAFLMFTVWAPSLWREIFIKKKTQIRITSVWLRPYNFNTDIKLRTAVCDNFSFNSCMLDH